MSIVHDPLMPPARIPALAAAIALGLAAGAAWTAVPAFAQEPPAAGTLADTGATLPPVVLRALGRLREGLRQQAYADIWRSVCAEAATACGTTFLVVDVARQRLDLFLAGRFRASFPVSTSRYGIGQRSGSDRTPTGLFRVSGVVGLGGPPHQVLDDRGPTGAYAVPVRTSGHLAASRIMLGRILLLEGLQPGWNLGGNVDAAARDIYIHGSANVGMLGQPASEGCVQVAPRVIVVLARVTPPGALVLITPGTGDPRRIPGPPLAGGAAFRG